MTTILFDKVIPPCFSQLSMQDGSAMVQAEAPLSISETAISAVEVPSTYESTYTSPPAPTLRVNGRPSGAILRALIEEEIVGFDVLNKTKEVLPRAEMRAARAVLESENSISILPQNFKCRFREGDLYLFEFSYFPQDREDGRPKRLTEPDYAMFWKNADGIFELEECAYQYFKGVRAVIDVANQIIMRAELIKSDKVSVFIDTPEMPSFWNLEVRGRNYFMRFDGEFSIGNVSIGIDKITGAAFERIVVDKDVDGKALQEKLNGKILHTCRVLMRDSLGRLVPFKNKFFPDQSLAFDKYGIPSKVKPREFGESSVVCSVSSAMIYGPEIFDASGDHNNIYVFRKGKNGKQVASKPKSASIISESAISIFKRAPTQKWDISAGKLFPRSERVKISKGISKTANLFSTSIKLTCGRYVREVKVDVEANNLRSAEVKLQRLLKYLGTLRLGQLGRVRSFVLKESKSGSGAFGEYFTGDDKLTFFEFSRRTRDEELETLNHELWHSLPPRAEEGPAWISLMLAIKAGGKLESDKLDVLSEYHLTNMIEFSAEAGANLLTGKISPNDIPCAASALGKILANEEKRIIAKSRKRSGDPT